MSRFTTIEAVLFDLDGTFADTAPDLAFALNKTLQHWQKPPLPVDEIRPIVSQGGIALIKHAFTLDPASEDFEQRRQFLLRVYLQNICRQTRLFAGIEALLQHLQQRSLPWGIVTNKPGWLTDPLLKAMGMDRRSHCVVSGDTCKQRKPHPQPLLFACEQLQVDPEQVIYIGDDQRDIIAGQAAGMITVAACYGYIVAGDTPESWGADFMIANVDELLALLQQGVNSNGN